MYWKFNKTTNKEISRETYFLNYSHVAPVLQISGSRVILPDLEPFHGEKLCGLQCFPQNKVHFWPVRFDGAIVFGRRHRHTRKEKNRVLPTRVEPGIPKL